MTLQTRERILAAADALQYRPNVLARALRDRRDSATNRPRLNALGVVAAADAGELNDYLLEICTAIISAGAEHGQNTTIFTLNDWRCCGGRLRSFCDGRIDGLILVAPNFERRGICLPAEVPFVTIHANHTVPGGHNIESDDEAGAYKLVRHLIARGHRRILHLSGPPGVVGAERRVRGYRRALRSARIPFNAQLMVSAGYTTELGRQAMLSWLERHGRDALPDAIFCANDPVAAGCLEALAEAQVKVPDEVSVAGFEDTFIARLISPQLTSMRLPLAEMGARAVELLLARIERPATSPAVRSSTVFPVTLVQRASVGARRSARRSRPHWS